MVRPGEKLHTDKFCADCMTNHSLVWIGRGTLQTTYCEVCENYVSEFVS